MRWGISHRGYLRRVGYPTGEIWEGVWDIPLGRFDEGGISHRRYLNGVWDIPQERFGNGGISHWGDVGRGVGYPTKATDLPMKAASL
jgi:hypothetical protein